MKHSGSTALALWSLLLKLSISIKHRHLNNSDMSCCTLLCCTVLNSLLSITNINIAAGSNGGVLQRFRTREKRNFCTICHCIEKSMLQTYQWDIQFEMQYCQDPQGPWLQAKEGAGPWSGHNVMKWCVCVLPSVWCVRGKSVSVRIGARRAGSAGAGRDRLYWKSW